jgi:hypothetical protein
MRLPDHNRHQNVFTAQEDALVGDSKRRVYAIFPAGHDAPSFRFGGFLLRATTVSDLHLAATWVYADPDHRKTTEPEFWLEQTADANSFLLEDSAGPVFFFKLEKVDDAMAIYIQFGPEQTTANRSRTMAGLTEGFAWLEKRLADVGVRRVYFHSRNPTLIYFSQKRLGFVWDGRKLERKIGDDHGEADSEGAKSTPEQQVCRAEP